jgi:hypothetical protein
MHIVMIRGEILLIVATYPLTLEVACSPTRKTLLVGMMPLLYLGVAQTLVTTNAIVSQHFVVVPQKESTVVIGRGAGGDMTHTEAATIVPLERGVQNLTKVLKSV